MLFSDSVLTTNMVKNSCVCSSIMKEYVFPSDHIDLEYYLYFTSFVTSIINIINNRYYLYIFKPINFSNNKIEKIFAHIPY